MRVLVMYGSDRGGTAGLAVMVGKALGDDGIAATVRPAGDSVDDLAKYDAVIVGGSVYSNRWQRDARRFVRQHARELQSIPVWLFSSGPLDDSAATEDIPPTKQVASLMTLVKARGHATFGGTLSADATGFAASAMAKQHAGDWRDEEQVRQWVHGIARGGIGPAPTRKGGVRTET